MATATVLVCDDCGEAADVTIKMSVPGKGNILKDLDNACLATYIKGGRRPKRGRKPAIDKAA